MCGINGFLFYRGQSVESNHNRITNMNAKIHHRGPDDCGEYVDPYAAIGMTRLSIIDLENGRQPISNEDGRLQIVLNGEIYNYKELQIELKNQGHQFKTQSDTEVVLHAYEEYGTDCLQRIKGMFAFAIYNTVDHSIFLARDRIGEKPLYYSSSEDYFLFASELKSIFAAQIGNWKIDQTALAQYLTLTYIPAPRSILEGVYKLKPGHYLSVSGTGQVEIRPYWDVVYNQAEQIQDYQECKRLLRDTMYRSVEKCMVSDVPVGAFMSGGIDSTIVTGIMSQISASPIDSFTIGFREKAYDESSRAAIAAKHFGTKHHVEIIDYPDMLEVIDRIIDNMDEPFADSSIIPTYLVSQMAQKKVKTVLTGDAGDELFGGYDKYLIGHYADLYNRVPWVLREQVVERIVYALPDTSILSRKVRKVIRNSKQDSFTQRRNMMCLGMDYDDLGQLLQYESGDVLSGISDYYHKYSDQASELDCTFYTDEKLVLEGDMLAKVDRASMLVSLETRVPMLYPDMVELAARIPSKYKIDAKNKKIILKDTFSDLLPKELLKAPKMGFGVPIGKWMRNEMKEDLLATLNKDVIEQQGLLKYETVQLLLDEHMAMKKDHTAVLFAVYLFEKWCGNYH